MTYWAAVFCFSALYAVLFRLTAGYEGAVAGGIVFGMVFGLEGIVLWSVTNYIAPLAGMKTLRTFMSVATGLTVIALAVGAETAAVYLSSEETFTAFVPAIPLRAMVCGMAFVMLIQYYRCKSASAKELEVPAAPVIRQEKALEQISVRSGKKISVINATEIEYLQAEGDYVAIVTTGGRWLKEQTMKYFEENLPCDRFIRVHRSYIVNTASITKLERYGNLYQVTLSGGSNIKVSAGGYKLLKERLRL